MIYKSIADRLRLRLNSSDYNIGSPLPGEKALAKEFGVARMTIRKALDLLVSWGLVERRHGSGTFVARKDVHHETTNLTGLVEVLRQQGKEVQSKVLQFEVMPAPPAIASQLRIQVDERIYFSRRVRYVDGKPLMLEDSFMPVKLFRNLSLAHLEGSKFDYIEKECGITISGNYESLTPVLADKTAGRLYECAGTDAAAAHHLPFLQRQRRVPQLFRDVPEHQRLPGGLPFTAYPPGRLVSPSPRTAPPVAAG